MKADPARDAAHAHELVNESTTGRESTDALMKRALRIEGSLAGEFVSTDPSDIWTQQEVFDHIFFPLSELILDLVQRLGEERAEAQLRANLAEKGWEGASRCRCLAEGEGYVACPPQMCEAQTLLDECRDLSRLHRIALHLLTDEQMDEYRRRRDAEPE